MRLATHDREDPALPKLLHIAAALGFFSVFAGIMPARAAGQIVNVPVGGDVAGAVAAVGNSGGGTVVLAAGIYNIFGPISINSNTTLTGQGASTIILGPPSPKTWSMIQDAGEGVKNITIENLVVDGNIPLGAFVANGGANPYGGAGLYFFAYTYPITNITVQNVEIRNSGIGILTGEVHGLLLQNDYIHDNNPGNFSHNAYLVASYNVTISHSRFIAAHNGDGLHFDFGATAVTITKSEFSGNAGEGILDQGNGGVTITDSILNFNGDDGINTSSGGTLQTRLQTAFNGGYAINESGGSGTYANFETVGNGAGAFQIFGIGAGATVKNVLFGTTANQYLAVLAQGALGAADTADWSTKYAGYSNVLGEVDFNANHLGNGLLTFVNVGAVGSKIYQVTLRYSNGSGGTLTMPLTLNGAKTGVIAFAPTGSWTAWRFVTVPMNLVDGPNTVALSAQPAGAPELDYLQVAAPVPAAPAAVCSVSGVAVTPYENKILWTQVPGASGYTVLRGGSVIATGIAGTSYLDNGIRLAGQTASYQVRSYDQGGSAAACRTVAVTSPVDAPAGLQAARGGGGIALNWMSANGATSYHVKRATGTAAYVTVATVTNTTSLASASNYEQSYTDATAVSGVTYSYVVSSVGPLGESGNSYAVAVTR
jgi:hypothetical protein